LAAVHHREIIAELLGEVEILLDQHDGDVAEPTQVGDGAADVLDDRRLKAFGRLVEQEQARRDVPSGSLKEGRVRHWGSTSLIAYPGLIWGTVV
jgi:hypothetical protein